MTQRYRMNWRKTCIYEAKAKETTVARLYIEGVHRSESAFHTIECNQTLREGIAIGCRVETPSAVTVCSRAIWLLAKFYELS